MTTKKKKNPARKSFRVPAAGVITIDYGQPGNPVQFRPASKRKANPSRRRSKKQLQRGHRAAGAWVRSGGTKHTSLRAKKTAKKARR